MSINLKQLTPAIAIHPGEILQDELKARGISQKEFAILTGILPTLLNEIIKGKRGINADHALVISKALKMDASLWMNMQSSYELDQAKIREKTTERITAINLWQMIEDYIPVKYFKKQEILSGDPIHDIPIIKNIYQVENFDQLPALYSQAQYSRFRKSEKLSIDKINLVGWVKLIQYQATKLEVKKFDASKETEIIEALKTIFRKNKKTIDKTEQLLKEFGIKLIIQQHPEKCAVDGITFWSMNNPAIGMSLRYKRIDYFAFTIMHELGHVFRHLINNRSAEFIDLDKDQNTSDYKNSKEEKEANEFSSNSLIDDPKWKEFKKQNPDFDKKAIAEFALNNKIHPAIIQGRFCFESGTYNVKSNIDRVLY